MHQHLSYQLDGINRHIKIICRRTPTSASNPRDNCRDCLEFRDHETKDILYRINSDCNIVAFDATIESSGAESDSTPILFVVTIVETGQVFRYHISLSNSPSKSSAETSSQNSVTPLQAFLGRRNVPFKRKCNGVINDSKLKIHEVKLPLNRIAFTVNIQHGYVFVFGAFDSAVTVISIGLDKPTFHLRIEIPRYFNVEIERNAMTISDHVTAVGLHRFSSTSEQEICFINRITSKSHSWDKKSETIVVYGTRLGYLLYFFLPSDNQSVELSSLDARLPSHLIDRLSTSISTILFTNLFSHISPYISHLCVLEKDNFLTCLGIQTVVGYVINSDLSTQLIDPAISSLSQLQAIGDCLVYINDGKVCGCRIAEASKDPSIAAAAPTFFSHASLQWTLVPNIALSHPSCADVSSILRQQGSALHETWIIYMNNGRCVPFHLVNDELGLSSTIDQLRKSFGFSFDHADKSPLINSSRGIEDLSSEISRIVKLEQSLRMQIDQLNVELLNSTILLSLLNYSDIAGSNSKKECLLSTQLTWDVNVCSSMHWERGSHAMEIRVSTQSVNVARALHGRFVTISFQNTSAPLLNQVNSAASLMNGQSVSSFAAQITFTSSEPAAEPAMFVCHLAPLAVSLSILDIVQVQIVLNTSFELDEGEIEDCSRCKGAGLFLFAKTIEPPDWAKHKLIDGKSSSASSTSQVVQSLIDEALQHQYPQRSLSSVDSMYSVEFPIPRIISSLNSSSCTVEIADKVDQGTTIESNNQTVKKIQDSLDEIIKHSNRPGSGTRENADVMNTPRKLVPLFLSSSGQHQADGTLNTVAISTHGILPATANNRTDSSSANNSIDVVYLKCQTPSLIAKLHREMIKQWMASTWPHAATSYTHDIGFSAGDVYCLPNHLQQVFDRAIKLYREIHLDKDNLAPIPDSSSNDSQSSSTLVGSLSSMMNGVELPATQLLDQLSKKKAQLQELVGIFKSLREAIV